MLEAHAAGLAATRRKQEDIDELRTLLAAQQDAFATADHAQFAPAGELVDTSRRAVPR